MGWCNAAVDLDSGTVPRKDALVEIPETRYAKAADGVHIAYQVVGDGPIDILFVLGWVTHLERMWIEPRFARFYTRLASFSRVMLFDKRGVGLSDRVSEDRLPSLEVRMDDARAVMDAVGSERAAHRETVHRIHIESGKIGRLAKKFKCLLKTFVLIFVTFNDGEYLSTRTMLRERF